MPAQWSNAADEAYASTRERIISGALAGGTLLSEVEVGADLGLSRTPVHEAFLRLAAEQFLTLIPRRERWSVRSPRPRPPTCSPCVRPSKLPLHGRFSQQAVRLRSFVS